MSDLLPALSEIEERAALTPARFEEHYVNRDKRLRNRRLRRLTKKALIYAVAGVGTVVVGGELLDRGLDQVDRDREADTPSSLIAPYYPESGPFNSGRDSDGTIRIAVGRQ